MSVQRQVPIAEQVALLLHSRILEGVYTPGERLPSEVELAQELEVSRGSVRSALASLSTAGLIARRQGDGTYVQNVDSKGNSLMYAMWEFNYLIESSGRVPSIRGAVVERRQATPGEASALDIAVGAGVVAVRRVFYADEQPIILSLNISPACLFDASQELDGSIGLHGFLGRYCHKEVARIDLDISPTLADAQVQAALQLEPSQPVLRIEQVFRDANRKPLVFAINHHCDRKLSLHDVRPWHAWSRAR